MVLLLGANLSEWEDALGQRALPGAVDLQAQHQRATAQRLETQCEHKRLHEGRVLEDREDIFTSCVFLKKRL